ncbi:MAG TPA: multicopper oxidase domain-containing protein [Steroidobacteraceae bacterium]
MNRLLSLTTLAASLTLGAAAQAAAPGITSTTGAAGAFNLTAQIGNLNQPDGNAVYSWGYGCSANSSPKFAPAAITNAACGAMQVPGPTLIVTEGTTVTVTLTNNLPTAAGNTSILFPGFAVTAAAASTQPIGCSSATTPAPTGLLVTEAAPGCAVTYTFVASSPGTRAYYSGTQSDLQVEMGLYGAIIVIPTKANVPAACITGLHASNLTAEQTWGESDFRLAPAAYDHPSTCYDREYLFQFAEMDSNIHRQALAQVTAKTGCVAGSPGCTLQVPTEPYRPSYFLINGRSMPDDMDPNYGAEYPNQPYNGNPHMHPGELTLIRVIGQGRWEHPFHEHANHVRILARDGNLILTPNGRSLAGMLMFTTDTFPGQSFDGIFYFTGRGLNWDMYGHSPTSPDALAKLPCTPDANGYNTGAPTALNYYEWCQDHNKPLEANPIGDVNAGGPITLPSPNIFANGAWYSGSPYLGPDATLRADSTLANFTAAGNTAPGKGAIASGCVTGVVGATGGADATPNCSNLQPSNVQANPANERGWAYMWHSHNEREITTNNVFPGGMFMMMLVDSREFVIDEAK